MRLILTLLFAWLCTGCESNNGKNDHPPGQDTTGNNGGGPVGYYLEDAFPHLAFEQPVELISDGKGRLFVLEQEGVIRTWANDRHTREAGVFLDIRSKVRSGGEMGLLGIALHPDYASNGYFYINYTRGNPLETVIARFTAKPGSTAADAGSELVLLTYAQPYNNHNGGKIAFGPDGFLYISAGDGGSAGDPQNNSQNRASLLGKILRIDVNSTQGGLHYGIPADNPFKGNADGFREEIYAWGLRNVWKFAFDTQGRLWAADVGQNEREEIDLVEKGRNYGWRVMEGNACYNPGNCDATRFEPPIWEYLQNNSTGRSVTGGYVYEGDSLPGLKGRYIYGDYVSGNVWALSYEGGSATNALLFDSGQLISSFGADEKGSLFVCAYGRGKIYRLAAR